MSAKLRLQTRDERIEEILRQIKTKPHTARFRYREMVMYQQISKGAKVLYAVIDEQVRDQGEKQLSQETIARLARVSPRSLRRYLAELRREGLISVERSGFAGNCTFRLPWFDPSIPAKKTSIPANVGRSFRPTVAAPISIDKPKENLSKEEQRQRQPAREPPSMPSSGQIVPIDNSFSVLIEAATALWGPIAEGRIEATRAGWFGLSVGDRVGIVQYIRDAVDQRVDPAKVKRLPDLALKGYWREALHLPFENGNREKAERQLKITKFLMGEKQ